MRLCLAVVAHETIPFSFLEEFEKIQGTDRLPLVTAKGFYVHLNRTRAVSKALYRDDWDRLLFLDPDMFWPENFREIAESWTDPIVGGLYFQRTYPNHRAVAGNFLGDKIPMFYPFGGNRLREMVDKPGLYPCDMIGTGCLGIRRDVLEEWTPRPWFDTLVTEHGEFIGEDVLFGWNAKRQGIRSMLDTRIVCDHKGAINIGLATYLQTSEQPT